MLITTDNNCGKEIDCRFIPDFQRIANKTIGSLTINDNPNLLIFPNDFTHYGDNIGEAPVFALDDNLLTTNNIMGFVGVNNSEITIQSRFAKNNRDYFLHYLLQKVFCVNLFDLKHGTDNETIFDFLLYLFPYYLKKALRQGVYKEYHKQAYNDANVKGSIDFSRHIRYNIPFAGNIAYSVREHSYDNKITQLIRHTIEFIKQHEFGTGILDSDPETQHCVNTIIHATPNYSRRERITIINENIKPFAHPYFVEYRELKKICMQLLRYEGLKYGKEKDKIYGLLFDGAWLWEEYLNTILTNYGFVHPRNRLSEGAIYLFTNSKGRRFPDFWKENFILDAKYKRLSGSKVDRDDMHQIISYMYTKKAAIGGFIVPADSGSSCYHEEIGQLHGYGGSVHIWHLAIPQQSDSFHDFCKKMQQSEKVIAGMIAKK